MPETRVPMTLRDQFLQDPFFKSAWEDMESFRGSFLRDSQSKKMIESSEKREERKEENKEENSSLNRRFGRYLVPRKWMMPSLLNGEESLKLNDSGVINTVNDDTKLELSLNTAGYKPSELSVNVTDGQLIVEGKHFEKSEAGEVMVSRQFRREYGLDSQSKLTEVVSNLSQDGVLVITVPKEKRIQELKEDGSLHENESCKIKRQRESLSPSSTVSSSTSRLSSSQSRSETSNGKFSDKMAGGGIIPMTRRGSFFDDPFFKDTWEEVERSQREFFETSRKQFEESLKRMQSALKDISGDIVRFEDDFPKMSPKMNFREAEDLKVSDNKEKVELSLDTAGYKPDELKVTAGQGVVRIEGRHEERSQSGEVMVSRNMTRQYLLPSSADPALVTSNLSTDGVLLITIPKALKAVAEDRNVPIKMK